MAKEKLYYSISEVAERFNINQSNLRYWEKEFKQLKPRRNDKGTRFYTKDDIQLVQTIIYLIKDQKLTLDGVRRRLNDKKDLVIKQQEIVERLTSIKAELKGMIALIAKESLEPKEPEYSSWGTEIEEDVPTEPKTPDNSEASSLFSRDLFS